VLGEEASPYAEPVCELPCLWRESWIWVRDPQQEIVKHPAGTCPTRPRARCRVLLILRLGEELGSSWGEMPLHDRGAGRAVRPQTDVVSALRAAWSGSVASAKRACRGFGVDLVHNAKVCCLDGVE
jgi:hypothetical protein